MRHHLFAALGAAGLALSACAPAGPASPEAAMLGAEVLTVRMTDGSLCKADWRAGPGRLEACGLDYRVTVLPGTNPARQIMDGLFRALGAEGALAPRAEVVLTDAAGGETVFTSPPPAGG